jgi:hypothetical protein
MKNEEREMIYSLSKLPCLYVKLLELPSIVYESRSEHKRIKPPVTRREQGYSIDDSKKESDTRVSLENDIIFKSFAIKKVTCIC